MKPITRAELRSAQQTVRAEKERLKIREQELIGQLWAEQVYNRIKEAAEAGHTQYECHCPDSFTSISHNQAILNLREWFPDSDVETLLYGVLSGHDRRTSIRVKWGVTDVPTTELLERRFEKETNW